MKGFHSVMPFRDRLTTRVGKDSNQSHHPQAQQHHATYSHKSILQHDSMVTEKGFMSLKGGRKQRKHLFGTLGIRYGGKWVQIKQTRLQNDTQLTHNKNGMKRAASLETILSAELLLHFLSKNGIHETRRTIGSNRSPEEENVRLRSIL